MRSAWTESAGQDTNGRPLVWDAQDNCRACQANLYDNAPHDPTCPLRPDVRDAYTVGYDEGYDDGTDAGYRDGFNDGFSARAQDTSERASWEAR